MIKSFKIPYTTSSEQNTVQENILLYTYKLKICHLLTKSNFCSFYYSILVICASLNVCDLGDELIVALAFHAANQRRTQV